ncbi:MAG: NUMOD4 domain-containing protein [Dehalococcoidales bacterium]|nr:NUMOD4 domain-containing protein [Dehalococcoidales bacterium]
MEELEIWLPVVGFEALYEVSNFGRIRRIKQCRGAQVGRVKKPQKLNGGYLLVQLWKNNKYYPRLVHVLVITAFQGPPPEDDLETNHKNGIKEDNRNTNLEWVTHSENNLHAYRELGHKRVCGVDVKTAKLNETKVAEIRTLHQEGHTTRELGRRYGVNHTVISGITRNKTWRHVN